MTNSLKPPVGHEPRSLSPVTAKIKLDSDDVRQWLMGDKPLPGGDESSNLDRNIPDTVARQRRESVRIAEEMQRQFPQGAALVPLENPAWPTCRT